LFFKAVVCDEGSNLVRLFLQTIIDDDDDDIDEIQGKKSLNLTQFCLNS
jgi:hypothetical protein